MDVHLHRVGSVHLTPFLSVYLSSCPSLCSPVFLSVGPQVFHFPSSWHGLLGSCTTTMRSRSCDQTGLLLLNKMCSTIEREESCDRVLIDRCWFGKRAGVYTDYIYQGPMILVLLVGAQPVHLKNTTILLKHSQSSLKTLQSSLNTASPP